MADGNGKGEEEVVKWCPFLDKWCTKEVASRCALNEEMTRHAGGLQQKFNMCAFKAIVVLLSEINMKTQGGKAEKVVMPRLYRG